MNAWLFLLALGLAGQEKPSEAAGPFTPAPGHWPQWRGPSRDNVSAETGLLKEWPAEGPKLLWKITGLGDGMAPVSVAGGLLFTVSTVEQQEVLFALDGAGKKVWSQTLGPAQPQFIGMRFLQQRMPTVDDEHLYVVTAMGRLLCLKTADGRIVWQKDYPQDFGGRTSGWKFGDRPLVDGNLLICTPGGRQGMVRALNKLTGETVWRSAEYQETAQFPALIAVEIAGVRHYVAFTLESVAGIAAEDGRLLWRAERRGATVVVPTPIYKDGVVFVTSGHGVGCNAFQVERVDGQFQVKELYSGKQLIHLYGGLLLLGDHLYGMDPGRLKCVELKTGKVVWEDRSVVSGSAVSADGHLVIRGDRGPIVLVEATPEGYRERGRFNQPDRSAENAFSSPVIAGGRLYLRDLDALFCYDLRGSDYKEAPPVWNILARVTGTSAAAPKPPPAVASDAIFIATPQDVVAKMIEAAKVTKADVVYDLGSGDGRIVIAASKSHGCKSVGFEIHPGLVKESRLSVRQAGVDDLVTIEEKDLFTVDLEPASVVMLYLGEPNNAKLLPQLKKLKAGSRIVSHAHLLGAAGPKPDQEIKLVSKEDQAEHTIYVWTTPLAPGPDRK